MVLSNGYSDLFGDHWGDVWRTVNPLSPGPPALRCWIDGAPDSLRGKSARRSHGLGAPGPAIAYFVNYWVVWETLDPARLLTALAWA